MTPLGKKKVLSSPRPNSSTLMGSKNGIDPKNIIMVNFEEIQKDARKAFEECKKASEGKELRGKKA